MRNWVKEMGYISKDEMICCTCRQTFDLVFMLARLGILRRTTLTGFRGAGPWTNR